MGFYTLTHPLIVLQMPTIDTFDARVFYPNAPSNRSAGAYKRHKQAKKRGYGQSVCEIEHGVFTPLVLSSNGGMGKEATFYKRLEDMIAQKRSHHYSMVMGWLRCRISFAVLRWSILCSWSSSALTCH